MMILGIDPGETTGWCLYDSDVERAVCSGTFPRDQVIDDIGFRWDCVVLERPKGYGPTRPQLVDCGYVCGRLSAYFEELGNVHEMTRLEVCRGLTDAVFGAVRVRNDATAWAALKILFGEDAAKKGGKLHGVRSHGRAALAVAVAFSLTKKDGVSSHR